MVYKYTTAQAVYDRTGLTATEVDLTSKTSIIDNAESEMEMLIGRQFGSAASRTEYFSIGRADIIGNKQTSIVLSNLPLQSITEFKTLDMDGNATNTFGTLTSVQIAAGTYSTTDYWLDTQEDPITGNIAPNGKIVMKTMAFSQGTNNVKLAYTYGYTAVPDVVKDLATCMAGIRAWIAFVGGQYNRLDNYSVPSQSVGKGSITDRVKFNIDELQAEADRLLDRIGRKQRTMFYTSGGNR